MVKDAAEIATELAKALPIKEAYQDAVSPPARVAGTILEDAAKTIQLVLAPFQALAMLQDRFRRFLERTVAKVPPEQQVSPPPQVLGPVLEGIRYEPEGTPIDEMFANLLASACDASRADRAHPAYPQIIRQLSADEVRILLAIRDRGSPAFRRQQDRPFDESTHKFGEPCITSDDLPRADLMFAGNVDFYVNHLNALGLAGLYMTGTRPIRQQQVQIGSAETLEYHLTEVGRHFMSAVSPT